MILHELKTPLWLATPKGDALARFVLVQGLDHDIVWIVEAESNGAFWLWRNPEVRGQRNFTQGFGRPFPAGVERFEFDPANLPNPGRP
jgi:hypothetical protein